MEWEQCRWDDARYVSVDIRKVKCGYLHDKAEDFVSVGRPLWEDSLESIPKQYDQCDPGRISPYSLSVLCDLTLEQTIPSRIYIISRCTLERI